MSIFKLLLMSKNANIRTTPIDSGTGGARRRTRVNSKCVGHLAKLFAFSNKIHHILIASLWLKLQSKLYKIYEKIWNVLCVLKSLKIHLFTNVNQVTFIVTIGQVSHYLLCSNLEIVR